MPARTSQPIQAQTCAGGTAEALAYRERFHTSTFRETHQASTHAPGERESCDTAPVGATVLRAPLRRSCAGKIAGRTKRCTQGCFHNSATWSRRTRIPRDGRRDGSRFRSPGENHHSGVAAPESGRGNRNLNVDGIDFAKAAPPWHAASQLVLAAGGSTRRAKRPSHRRRRRAPTLIACAELAAPTVHTRDPCTVGSHNGPIDEAIARSGSHLPGPHVDRLIFRLVFLGSHGTVFIFRFIFRFHFSAHVSFILRLKQW